MPKNTKDKTKVIRRIPDKAKRGFGKLSDEEKYQCLHMYMEGKGYTEIGKALDMNASTLSSALSTFVRSLTLVQETNKLENSKVSTVIDRSVKTCKEISEEFIEDSNELGLIFAWYYGKTNDIRYSLKASGLDKGIPANTTANTRNYILRVRGQYLLSVPAIRKEVSSVRDQELTENKVDRKYVMSEILGQLEEEKILREDNPASRQNSIKLIKMLGDSVGAFTTNINVSEVNPEDSLQMLIELAEQDIIENGSYNIEDAEYDEVRSTTS